MRGHTDAICEACGRKSYSIEKKDQYDGRGEVVAEEEDVYHIRDTEVEFVEHEIFPEGFAGRSASITLCKSCKKRVDDPSIETSKKFTPVTQRDWYEEGMDSKEKLQELMRDESDVVAR